MTEPVSEFPLAFVWLFNVEETSVISEEITDWLLFSMRFEVSTSGWLIIFDGILGVLVFPKWLINDSWWISRLFG